MVRLFEAFGWSTLQTDAIAHDLLKSDNAVRSALEDRWGELAFQEDGTVDRKAIASLVFSNTQELDWLESLLHPKVRNIWETKLAGDQNLHWLVEIPLLFEKKLETQFDFTICVESNVGVVEKRALSKGHSKADIKQRCKRQMSLEEKIRRSDYVISNSGTLDFLKLQVEQLVQTIK